MQASADERHQCAAAVILDRLLVVSADASDFTVRGGASLELHVDRIHPMFTLEQIDAIHDRLGRQHTLVQYLRALNAIGVERSDSFIVDGHSEHFGRGGEKVVTPPAHEVLTIAGTSSRDGLVEALALHGQGKTSYVEMSKGLAESGVEKWSFDTNALTIAYYDKAGNELLVEAVR